MNNKKVLYTVETSKWLNFENPINSQMSCIFSTVTAPKGNKSGLTQLKEKRFEGLKGVETSSQAKARLAYTIKTTTDFPSNFFQYHNKPLSFREVTQVTASALNGMGAEVDAEAIKINQALEDLNTFLQNVDKPTNKNERKAWEIELTKVIETINRKAKTIGCDEVKEKTNISSKALRAAATTHQAEASDTILSKVNSIAYKLVFLTIYTAVIKSAISAIDQFDRVSTMQSDARSIHSSLLQNIPLTIVQASTKYDVVADRLIKAFLDGGVEALTNEFNTFDIAHNYVKQQIRYNLLAYCIITILMTAYLCFKLFKR